MKLLIAALAIALTTTAFAEEKKQEKKQEQKQERKRAGMGRRCPKEIFAKLDTDKDGKLSQKEFEAGMKARMEKMKERHGKDLRGKGPHGKGKGKGRDAK